MCWILELMMLVLGHWILVRAQVPRSLTHGGKGGVQGTPARVIGCLLILPLPAASLMGVMLATLFGEHGIRYALCCEAAVDIGAGLLALILMRAAGRWSKPATQRPSSP
jgi:hypothetical protein